MSLPSMRPNLNKQSVSPLFHLSVNLFVILWIVVTDLSFSDLEAFAVYVADVFNQQGAPRVIAPGTIITLSQWVPVGGLIIFDLVANIELYAAIKEYNGLLKAGISEARGRVTGDINLIPKDEQETIFHDMESYQLKSVRDTCALLRRQIVIAMLTLFPWSIGLVLHYAPIFPSLPDQLYIQVSAVVLVKSAVFVYWTYINYRLRFVKLRLLYVE